MNNIIVFYLRKDAVVGFYFPSRSAPVDRM